MMCKQHTKKNVVWNEIEDCEAVEHSRECLFIPYSAMRDGQAGRKLLKQQKVVSI
jgi:hypothetical protein